MYQVVSYYLGSYYIASDIEIFAYLHESAFNSIASGKPEVKHLRVRFII